MTIWKRRSPGERRRQHDKLFECIGLAVADHRCRLLHIANIGDGIGADKVKSYYTMTENCARAVAAQLARK